MSPFVQQETIFLGHRQALAAVNNKIIGTSKPLKSLKTRFLKVNSTKKSFLPNLACKYLLSP